MTISKYYRQLNPVVTKKVNHVERVKNLLWDLSEDIDLPSDVLDGFEYTQVDKSERSRVAIKVSSYSFPPSNIFLLNNIVELIISS